jgi:hypothetical protein
MWFEINGSRETDVSTGNQEWEWKNEAVVETLIYSIQVNISN